MSTNILVFVKIDINQKWNHYILIKKLATYGKSCTGSTTDIPVAGLVIYDYVYHQNLMLIRNHCCSCLHILHMRHVVVLLRVLRFLPRIKRHDITEIVLLVALNTSKQIKQTNETHALNYISTFLLNKIKCLKNTYAMPFKSELLSNDRFKNLLFEFMLLFAHGPKYLCGHKEGHAGPFLKRKEKYMLVTHNLNRDIKVCINE